VRQLFTSVQLPAENLIKIWNLCDNGDKGELTKREFVVALFLLHKCKVGEGVPDKLPDNLMEFMTGVESAPPAAK
jgi:hypothetical protein